MKPYITIKKTKMIYLKSSDRPAILKMARKIRKASIAHDKEFDKLAKSLGIEKDSDSYITLWDHIYNETGYFVCYCK